MEENDFHDKFIDNEPVSEGKLELFIIAVFSTLLVELIFWGLKIYLNHGRM